MGNCQAVDAAALVIQHPCGKLERMYWPVTASEVMKANPGHYVSLIIPLPVSDGGGGGGGGSGSQENSDDNRTVRFTRVKLLRPTETLVLGRAYRLVSTQDVVRVLRAKKHAKMKKSLSESGHLKMNSEKQSTSSESDSGTPVSEKNDQAVRSERHRQRSGSTNLAAGRSKSWRPTLQSISEAGS